MRDGRGVGDVGMGCGELSHISVKYECSVSRVSLSVPSLLYCYLVLAKVVY